MKDADVTAVTSIDVQSEFGVVRLSITTFGGNARLRVRDVRGGAEIVLDPLELESIAWCQHEDLSRIVNPATSRWRGLGD